MNAQAVELDQVLQQMPVWRGRGLPVQQPDGVPTGVPALERILPGGWPRGALSEILSEQQGGGELSLLMPALAQLSRADRWIALIAPPFVPYAPAWQAFGIDLSRVLVIRPQAHSDALWALEQALRSGSCGAVLAWPRIADERSLRRLQLAAEAGQSLGLLFRSHWALSQASPAAVRLRLDNVRGGVQARLLKRRGSWAGTAHNEVRLARQ